MDVWRHLNEMLIHYEYYITFMQAQYSLWSWPLVTVGRTCMEQANFCKNCINYNCQHNQVLVFKHMFRPTSVIFRLNTHKTPKGIICCCLWIMRSQITSSVVLLSTPTMTTYSLITQLLHLLHMSITISHLPVNYFEYLHYIINDVKNL